MSPEDFKVEPEMQRNAIITWKVPTEGVPTGYEIYYIPADERMDGEAEAPLDRWLARIFH